MNCNNCKALDIAIGIIESYQIDISNSEEIIGIDLAEKGFCQGVIYKNAKIMINRAKESQIKTE